MAERMLIAVDGSDASMKAVDYGAEIAKHHNASVTLIHVVPSGVIPDGLQQWTRAEHVADSSNWLYSQGVGESVLHTAADRLREQYQAQIEHLVEEGDAASQIISAAQSLHADILVMGCRGLGGLEGLVLGSVTHKVMHHAPCTVIVVR